ncbi:MAG: metal-dependent transcriptional regulator [Chloroflexales bacterium]|nr:metal-dependent transcriptional regulator [Chloroflexales bacterium]
MSLKRFFEYQWGQPVTESGRARSDHPRRRHHAGEEGPTAKEREYLEVIYYLAARSEPVIAARLARWMGVQPPTVTHVLQQLEDKKKLITRDARGEIRFTPEGFTLAEAMVRRHRILERFLVDVMGIPWHLIHEEAVRLEYALSPVMEARIISLVGASPTCPHGNPIPGNAEGYDGSTRLDQATPGSTFVVKRIVEEAEEDTDLICYLQRNDLVPGASFIVGDISPTSGVTLTRPGESLTVSSKVAEILWGEVLA